MNSKKGNSNKAISIILFIVMCLLLVSAICFTYLYVRDYKVNDVIKVASINEDKHINIYFVRHGKTDANVNNVFAGCRTDAKLIEEGIEDTKKTGRALRDVRFDKVYTSQMSRAMDTANIILGENNNESPAIEAINLLNDIDWGNIEGKTDVEVAKQFPDYTYAQFVGNYDDTGFISPINAMSENQMVNQFYDALKTICKESPDGGNVLVVGHSSFVWLLDALFTEEMKGIDGLNNSSITLLEYDRGQWVLDQVNMDADGFALR